MIRLFFVKRLACGWARFIHQLGARRRRGGASDEQREALTRRVRLPGAFRRLRLEFQKAQRRAAESRRVSDRIEGLQDLEWGARGGGGEGEGARGADACARAAAGRGARGSRGRAARARAPAAREGRRRGAAQDDLFRLGRRRSMTPSPRPSGTRSGCTSCARWSSCAGRSRRSLAPSTRCAPSSSRYKRFVTPRGASGTTRSPTASTHDTRPSRRRSGSSTSGSRRV
jgi:hypothetical protein